MKSSLSKPKSVSARKRRTKAGWCKAVLSAIMSIFMVLLSMPTYLAAQPASDGASSADDALILKTVQKADSVLSYFENSIGEGEYKVSQAEYDALKTESEALRTLLGTKDSKAVADKVAAVEAQILRLFGGNQEEGGRIVPVPKEKIKISANDFQPDCPPENAIDGKTNSLWHTSWSPEDTPFPHILTIELDKIRVLSDISILPRQDADSGRITSGEIYVGETAEDMKQIAAITDSGNREAVVIDLGRTAVKYIEIRSLSTTSVNTAIAEIGINAFESGVIDLEKGAMQITANTYNPSYPPENAIDGDTSTFWHSEWQPEVTPFPHI